MPTIARVDFDDPCTACGYNLRGLLMDDQCPECGLAVAETARGDGWETAPGSWVGALRGGAAWLRRGVLWMPLLVYPAVVLVVIGTFRLTQRRPGDDESWMAWNKRLLGRWIVVVGGVSMVLFALCCAGLGLQWLLDLGVGREGAASIFWGRSNQDAATLDAWFIGTHITFAMGFIMLCDYVRAMGQRVPDGALVAATTRLGRRTAVMLLGLVLLRGFMEIGGWVGGLKVFDHLFHGMAVGTFAAVAFVLGLLAWWWWGLVRWAGTLTERIKPRR